ncbi:uncharacterized protein METZ01_LOCUS207924 [marine metagenome]|uniref:Uncharacterized protein n=1 Tax=marine metagenome TaxID=408172 RepID=A0A382EWC8_9ZZZZ
MTQIARYAQFKKIKIDNVKGSIKLNLRMVGSVLLETIDVTGSTIETDYEIQSSEDDETIISIVKLARKGCWARQMVANPTTFTDTLVLNGETIKV